MTSITFSCLSLAILVCAAPRAGVSENAVQDGKPVFALDRQDPRLSAGKSVEVADRPDLRLRPGVAIVGRFRLDAHKRWAQNLVVKDGEYLLRVDNPDDGANLVFFVQIEGKWESRLRGPVVETNTWYDVRAVWTGQSMAMTVNGETFSQHALRSN
jgi:hypothetical protein